VDDVACHHAPIAELVDVSDLAGVRRHSLSTLFCMTWDAERLYVLFVAEDRDVWSVLEGHDAHLWNDEVVEIVCRPRR